MADETVKIKINDDADVVYELGWQTPEPELLPKTAEGFWAMAILGAAFLIFSLLLKNYLLAIIVILVAIIFYGLMNKRPEMINFRLDDSGLHINETFYPYENFESFWIFEGLLDNEVVFRYKKHFMPLLTIPFNAGDETKIRNMLKRHLPEVEEKASLIDLFRKRFF